MLRGSWIGIHFSQFEDSLTICFWMFILKRTSSWPGPLHCKPTGHSCAPCLGPLSPASLGLEKSAHLAAAKLPPPSPSRSRLQGNNVQKTHARVAIYDSGPFASTYDLHLKVKLIP